jgi:hypothetical protein
MSDDKRFVDITGQRFNHWVAVRYVRYGYFEFRCDCGVTAIRQSSGIKLGLSLMCHRCSSIGHTKHGKEGTRVYGIWAHMKRRCLNPKAAMYINYGARGIKVCERWLDFVNFYADMGDPPEGRSLGRIDNDGDYCPENCRWETQKQQVRNRRNTVFVVFEGSKLALNDLADEHNIPFVLVRNRLKVGWPIEKALSKPSQKS